MLQVLLELGVKLFLRFIKALGKALRRYVLGVGQALRQQRQAVAVDGLHDADPEEILPASDGQQVGPP